MRSPRNSRRALQSVLAVAGIWFPVSWLGVAIAAPAANQASAVVAQKPSFANLRARGRCAYRAERFDEARQLWSAAATLKPKDPDTLADLALAFQHLGMTDQAIQANRDVIRFAPSAARARDRARRIRRAAYYNLGKLKAARTPDFPEYTAEPSTCVKLSSETGCSRPVFACGRTGAISGKDGRFDETTARFALDSESAQIVVDGALISEFESGGEFGREEDETHDRANAPFYDVTLKFSSQTREAMPDEADALVASSECGCMVVHVDACARRLGLFCEWTSDERGVSAKPRSKAVELTFVREVK